MKSLSAARAASLIGDFTRSPAYAGLADALRVVIGDGRVGLGVRLPSERDLAEALGVSRTTATRAYVTLRESGYAEARQGAGTFTRVPGGRERAHDRALLPLGDRDDLIDLNCAATSAPPGLAEAYAEAMEDLPAYLGGQGYYPLGLPVAQAAIAAAYEARGLPTSPGQIMVTPGALAASSIVAHALTGTRDRVLVEAPTYPNATRALSSAGARIAAAVVDDDGWDLDALVKTAADTKPRLAYLIPDFQNPTGLLLADEARAELAARLTRHGVRPVIDEAHQQLGLGVAMPPPFASYAPEAITIGSASKSHWGGLRLGWIRAPHDVMDRLVKARVGIDLGAPVLEQLVLTALLTRHPEVVEGNRARLREQRDALVSAVRTHLPEWSFRVPDGGLALWCRLPRHVGTDIAAQAELAGVAFAAGPVFAPEGGLNEHVRIPWVRPADELEEAVRRIARAWAQVIDGSAGQLDRPTGRILVA
ncbi:MAG: PLP-dependent aminotransferase family protein [Nocardioides sp.]|jgi:DNA-binding transcriptional MocR family regulator